MYSGKNKGIFAAYYLTKKKKMKVKLSLFLSIVYTLTSLADEGMWMINNLDSIDYKRMQQLGLSIPLDRIYDTENPSIKDAVVQFDGGCTGITVSDKGLIFTNHHCGYDAIQSQSSLEHNYLRDGFVAQSFEEEIPIPGMYVAYLSHSEDISERILSHINHIDDEGKRFAIIDSLTFHIQDSINNNDPFTDARVESYYSSNAYFIQVYKNYTDVRMVFAPPSSVGKFGGDTDNWMWPRHTGDFSVFRVYAGKENQPADYNEENVPYAPRRYVPVSLSGFDSGSYAMTIGYPGSTKRYLSSWGIEQMKENENTPRIHVRGIKQKIWDEAMQENEGTKIRYSAKYARSSNYWKYSIGMNRGIERLDVVGKKRELETKFSQWLEKNADKKALYGEALDLMKNGYAASAEQKRAFTYLTETLHSGTEIVAMATNIIHFNPDDSLDQQLDYVQNTILAPYKDYEPALDQRVLAEMMTLAKKNLPAQYLPDAFTAIDKKYKGDYARYAADLFKKSVIPYPDKLVETLRNSKKSKKLEKDPAYELALSFRMAFFDIVADQTEAMTDVLKGERLFMAGLQEMMAEENIKLAPDANFTMRLSYGSIKGYTPYDRAWYDYYTTSKGIFEKYKKDDPEFHVQDEILDLLRSKDFGPYANRDGEMTVCFISGNDITGGNSGSPVFNGKGELLGLAFDGNWESMSGDLVFEPELQRTISVDVRYMLFMIDKWGKCDRLLKELTIEKE